MAGHTCGLIVIARPALACSPSTRAECRRLFSLVLQARAQLALAEALLAGSTTAEGLGEDAEW